MQDDRRVIEGITDYVAVTARLLASGEPAADTQAASAGSPPEALPTQVELSGQDGTLLAVVPIPGSGTSLVIVGYAVSAPDARPASALGTNTGLVIDRLQRRVWTDGRSIPLTFQEFELLAFLSEHPGAVYSRADLSALVWQGALGNDSRTVDVHVSRLRRKLGPVYGHCIATEYRAGYRFQAPGSAAPAQERTPDGRPRPSLPNRALPNLALPNHGRPGPR